MNREIPARPKTATATHRPSALLGLVAVVGGANCDSETADLAFDVGRLLAESGWGIVTGGRGGVMAAASAGVRHALGTAIGVLPGTDRETSPPNPDLDIAIYTGLGQARNQVVVLSGRAVIAVGGGWGTLSEIGLARKHGRPVVLLESWSLEAPKGEPPTGVVTARTAQEAVEAALRLAAPEARGTGGVRGTGTTAG